MRDIVLLIIFAGLLPACMARPWIGVLTWSWLAFMNPHRLTWGIARDLPFAQAVAIATLLGLLMTRERKPLFWTRETTLLVIMLAFFGLTTAFAWHRDLAWLQWIAVAKIILMTIVPLMLIYGKERIHWLLLVVAGSIGFFGLKGGIFVLQTGGVHSIYGPDDSFIADNNSLGLAMVMVLPLLVFLRREESNVWIRRILGITAFFTVISIVVTYSRGALIGLAAVLPFLFMRLKKKFLLLLVFVPLTYYGIEHAPDRLNKRVETIETAEEDQSFMQRIQAWSVAWNIAKERPLIGAGFKLEYTNDRIWLSYADRKYDKWGQSARAAHSIYFQVLGEHGFPGLALYLLLILLTMLRLRKLSKLADRDPDSAWIGNYAAALNIGLIGFVVAGAGLSRAYFDLFLLYVGVSAILYREAQERGLIRQPYALTPLRKPAIGDKPLGAES